MTKLRRWLVLTKAWFRHLKSPLALDKLLQTTYNAGINRGVLQGAQWALREPREARKFLAGPFAKTLLHTKARKGGH